MFSHLTFIKVYNNIGFFKDVFPDHVLKTFNNQNWTIKPIFGGFTGKCYSIEYNPIVSVLVNFRKSTIQIKFFRYFSGKYSSIHWVFAEKRFWCKYVHSSARRWVMDSYEWTSLRGDIYRHYQGNDNFEYYMWKDKILSQRQSFNGV